MAHPGYLQPLPPTPCPMPDCPRRATVMVVSGSGIEVGQFCGIHGRQQLGHLQVMHAVMVADEARQREGH